MVFGTINTLIILLYNRTDFLDVEKEVLLVVALATLTTSVVVFLCRQKNQQIVKRGYILVLFISIFLNMTRNVCIRKQNRSGR